MTDLEINRLCAEAFGFEPYPVHQYESWDLKSPAAVPCKLGVWGGECIVYDPLHNDEQCFRLIRNIGLLLEFDGHPPIIWVGRIWVPSTMRWASRENASLNRVVCECVAIRQQAKQ